MVGMREVLPEGHLISFSTSMVEITKDIHWAAYRKPCTDEHYSQEFARDTYR